MREMSDDAEAQADRPAKHMVSKGEVKPHMWTFDQKVNPEDMEKNWVGLKFNSNRFVRAVSTRGLFGQGIKKKLSFDGLDELAYLTSLSMKYTSGLEGLEKLPDALWSLKHLVTLELGHCNLGRVQTLPEDVQGLKQLRHLSLQGFSGLRSIPAWLWSLAYLAKLDLGGCEKLEAIPADIGNLKLLSFLDLRMCAGLTSLPTQLAALQSLSSLVLLDCTALASLPLTDQATDFPALTSLNLSNCTALKHLSTQLGDLKALINLNMSGLDHLVNSQHMGDLQMLSLLDLSWCKTITKLPDTISELRNLKTLKLCHCHQLASLSDRIADCVSLEELDLKGCTALTSLPSRLSFCVGLKTLNLSDCRLLGKTGASLPDLQDLKNLAVGAFGTSDATQAWERSGCRNFKSGPDTLATKYSFRGFHGTTLPEWVGTLQRLEVLDLEGCGTLTALSEHVGKLSALKVLNLRGTWALGSLPDLSHMRSQLEGNIKVSASSSLIDGWIGRGLASMDLKTGVGYPPGLTSLDLDGSPFKMLPVWVCDRVQLTSLDVTNCKRMVMVDPMVGNLSSLVSLDLHGCKGLRSLPDALSTIATLQSINLAGCSFLAALPCLSRQLNDNGLKVDVAEASHVAVGWFKKGCVKVADRVLSPTELVRKGDELVRAAFGGHVDVSMKYIYIYMCFRNLRTFIESSLSLSLFISLVRSLTLARSSARARSLSLPSAGHALGNGASHRCPLVVVAFFYVYFPNLAFYADVHAILANVVIKRRLIASLPSVSTSTTWTTTGRLH